MAKKYAITYAAILLAGAIAIVASGNLPRESEGLPRWQYLLTQFKVYLNYFQLIIFPQGFNIDHGIQFSHAFKAKETWGLIIIVLLLIAAAWLYKKNRLMSVGIFWFFATMLVESSIIPIRDPMFEHRLYLPMFGLSLFIVLGLYKILKQRLKTLVSVMIPLILILGFLTYDRNKDWKTNRTIWESSLKENPKNRRALTYVGRAYFKEDWRKAMDYFNRSIKLSPQYYHGWLNRALLCYDNELFEHVIISADHALKYARKPHEYLYLLRGVSYEKTGEYNKALQDLNYYINSGEKYKLNEAYFGRAETYYHMGAYEASLEDFKYAYMLNPADKKLLLNIIHLFYKLEKPEMVKKYIELAKQNGLEVKQGYINYAEQAKQ